MNLSGRIARRARLTAVALTLLALCLGAATARAVAGSPGPAPTLVVFGDSLSAGFGIRVEEGWVALLERRLAEQGYGYRVVNASVSGETSAGGLARLPRVLSVHAPAIIVVELGANDGLRGLPVEDLRHNLAEIVTKARGTGARVLLVGNRMPSNYGPKYTEEFYGSFAAVAKTTAVPLVPFLLDSVALKDSNFQPDRLHPTAAVQPLLLETVWMKLKPMLTPPRPTPHRHD